MSSLVGQFATFGRELFLQGLNSSHSGNMSVRDLPWDRSAYSPGGCRRGCDRRGGRGRPGWEMVTRPLAPLTSGVVTQARKASGARILTASPNPPLLSSMVDSTRAAANSKISVLFIRRPSFPVSIKDFIVDDCSDKNMGNRARRF